MTGVSVLSVLSQWLGLILSLSITRLLNEGALLPLCQSLHDNSNKLAPYKTGGRLLLPTSKSRDTKTMTKIENPALICFRYCALI